MVLFSQLIGWKQKEVGGSWANNFYTTFTNFSMEYLVMCMVYTDDGGIK